MTRTCELEHATMQTRSHGHKIQIEILAIQITASRFDAADAMSTVNSVVAMTLQVAQETRHCISLHHCIALKWDLALKNLEPSHIAHMDKLYKLAMMKRIEKSTCAWWQCHAQSS